MSHKTRPIRLSAGVAAFAAGAATILAAGMPMAANAQQVYIGSANGWRKMAEHPEQWSYVSANVNGFYINFIELLHADTASMTRLSSVLTHRNAYYESDSRSKGLGHFPDGGQFSRALEAKELSYLLDGGFTVPYASLNYGVDDDKLTDLRHIGMPTGTTRPCFAQYGGWTIGGDINKDEGGNALKRAEIGKTDGMSTDGPLSLWQADQAQMQSGSYSLVKYAHSLGKTAAIMVAPYNLKPTSQWLSVAQECVRQHEDAGAKPDIWIVFEYATNTPTLPETDANGQPADTITGMAYWLIHHIRDPAHWARLSKTSSAVAVGVTLRNDSKWIDLCPVLGARINDPTHQWNVRFLLGGKDVTELITKGDGLSFVGDLRLWPGDKRQIQVAFESKKPLSAGKTGAPVSVEVRMRPNPSTPATTNEVVTLRPFSQQMTERVALR